MSVSLPESVFRRKRERESGTMNQMKKKKIPCLFPSLCGPELSQGLEQTQWQLSGHLCSMPNTAVHDKV